ncbi:putative phospholipid-transporting ATPase 8 [Orobanche gracilis]
MSTLFALRNIGTINLTVQWGSYTILHILEFSSARKRMLVIVKNVENQLLLLCKGADSITFERLSDDVQDFVAVTKDHIKGYAEAGLRTLVVAYRELNELELSSWEEEFLMAQTSLNVDRDDLMEAAADKIERDLVLLGATAMETAINIGYACSLLREDMKQIVITLNSSEINELGKQGDKETVANTSVRDQIRVGKLQLSSPNGNSASFGLIIDGKSLSFALSKNLEDSFLDLAMNCGSVICCRSTPKQKALVTRLVKKGTRRTTLAIGDGANDVGMLQEADIGVGVSGVEGMQAAMSSDFAIAQFQFLERLLLVHGHWCYRRISMMICYFFYKNIAFGFTLFWFEAHASFSGQPAYNDWYMSTYNVFFTSLPVIALGVFDQDVSARLCLKGLVPGDFVHVIGDAHVYKTHISPLQEQLKKLHRPFNEKCPQQGGLFESGYFIMRYMFEIVQHYHNSTNLSKKLNGTATSYLEEEINEIRDVVADYLVMNIKKVVFFYLKFWE